MVRKREAGLETEWRGVAGMVKSGLAWFGMVGNG